MKNVDIEILPNEVLHFQQILIVFEHLYDGVEVNGRYRITTKAAFCGKTPIGKYVTGWVDKKNI